MTTESLDSREESIVRRLARFQQRLASRELDANSNRVTERDSLDSAAQRDLASCERLIALLGEVQFSSTEFDPAGLNSAVDEGDVEPARIGKFELLDECGRGGFGVVFRARDTILDRVVALKVPLPSVVSSSALRDRFLAEARTAAALSHPNLIPILEADHIGLLCYIAYTYCRGPSLARWMRENTGQVDARQAASVIAQIARAVSEAHALGICHRDIKPSNILLDFRSDDAPPDPIGLALDRYVPKLTDFGLARWAENPNPLSASGQLVGTVRYMSPEQVEGKSSSVGPASDVYSLGVVLYELLAGQTPFSGESDLRTLMRTLGEDAPDVTEHRSDLPRALSIICAKCLEKAPERRYRTTCELADDLDRFLNDAPIRAEGAGLWTRARKFMRRRPKTSIACVTGMLCLVIGLFEGVRYWQVWDAEESAAVARATIAEQEKTVARMQYAHQIRLAYESWKDGDVHDAMARLRSLVPGNGEPDVRGFLWRLLWKRCWYEGEEVGSHDGPAYCAALDPSGRWLATGGGDYAVCLWDLHSKKRVWRKIEHTGDVDCIAFSPTGDAIYSGGSDRSIRIWNRESGESEAFAEPGESSIDAIALFPDGRRLAAGGDSGAILIWDCGSRKQVGRLAGHRADVNDLAVTEDGQFLVSGGSDAAVHLWDVATNQLVRTFRGHNGSVTEVALIGETGVLLTAGVDGTIRRWSLEDGTLLQTKQAHAARIDALSLGASQTMVVTASKDETLKLWSINTLESISVAVCPSRIWDVVLESSTRQFYSTRDDGRVFCWTSEKREATSTWPSPKPYILGSSEDGAWFAFCDSTATLSIRQTGSHLTDPSYRVVAPEVEGVAFCGSGRLIATHDDRSNHILFWNWVNGTCVGEYRNETRIQPGLLSGPRMNGLTIESIAPNAIMVIDDVPSGKLVKRFGPYDGMVQAAVSRFDESVAIWKHVGSQEGELEIWKSVSDVHARYRLKTENWSGLIDLSPDGPWVAACLTANRLMIWEYSDGQEPAHYTLPKSITALAFSPLESLLVVGFEDGEIRFYSVPEFELVTSISANTGSIRSLVISPTASWMAAGHVADRSALFKSAGHVTYWYTDSLRPTNWHGD